MSWKSGKERAFIQKAKSPFRVRMKCQARAGCEMFIILPRHLHQGRIKSTLWTFCILRLVTTEGRDCMHDFGGALQNGRETRAAFS